VQLKISGIGHFGTDQPDALLKSASGEADTAREAVQASDDDLGILTLGQLDSSLQFSARIVSARLNVAEFSDQRSSACYGPRSCGAAPPNQGLTCLGVR
jgi:hypothetical protein